MRRRLPPSADPNLRAISRDIVAAPDSKLMRIVAQVDALLDRGPLDGLIAPLRQRLAQLRPPRPLRFTRLLFHPLSPLIVPPSHWRADRQAIPRTALTPMAEHVRAAMGAQSAGIEAQIAGRTDADTELITRLGRTLWPAAAEILARGAVPPDWATTELSETVYPPLAATIAELLGQAVALDRICAETANGLLSPRPEAIGAMLGSVTRSLPMLIVLLVTRLPAAMSELANVSAGPDAASIQAATDLATDRLLRTLDDEEGTEYSIAGGTLADAGRKVGGLATLLKHIDPGPARSWRREKLKTVRQRLDASCQVRFATSLQDDLLDPLCRSDAALDPETLESAARGLRALECEARTVGGGANYDLLLAKAAEAIQDRAVCDRLELIDRVRLVEILAGPDAAMALLDPTR